MLVDLNDQTRKWTVTKGREWDQITMRLGREPRTTVLLLKGEEWTGDRPAHLGDVVSCRDFIVEGDKPVAQPAVVPVELSAKAESSTIQVHIKADEKPRVWSLREGHEFEDLSQKVSEVLKWSDFTAFFDGHVWEPGGEAPIKGKMITINDRVYGGAPPKPVTWDPQFVPINQMLHLSFAWTGKERLSPDQVGINERVLDVSESAAHMEEAPLYCGHILRMVEDLSSKPYPHP
jgi:hypothetical protein